MSDKIARLKPEVHKLLKVRAANEGLSISKYIERTLKDEVDIDCSKVKKNEKAKFKFNW